MDRGRKPKKKWLCYGLTDQQTDEPTDRQSSLYSRMNATKKKLHDQTTDFFTKPYIPVMAAIALSKNF